MLRTKISRFDISQHTTQARARTGFGDGQGSSSYEHVHQTVSMKPGHFWRLINPAAQILRPQARLTRRHVNCCTNLPNSSNSRCGAPPAQPLVTDATIPAQPERPAAILACAPFATSGVAFEKQGLAEHRRHCRRLERFGNQEGRFWPFAGKKPFWVRGDENHGHLE